ncbi:MAG: DUF4435 domain-containing protein [Alphaproteobacteria bacterium]|nr:DUF4435 domain-containing protein [Alphaproteobacteria bacterium]MCB9797441.1 DUF4435 domain-containing protein [Alphaproteobacteria bacterium]
MEFQRAFRTSPDALFCFFEGDDEKYYGVRIRSVRGEYIGFRGGGKRGVLRLRDLVRSRAEYSRSFAMFFVDADMEDNSALDDHADVYCTPCYSIENLYCTPEAVERVLKAEFGLNGFGDSREDLETALTAYGKVLSAYLSAIRSLCAWVRASRRGEANLGPGGAQKAQPLDRVAVSLVGVSGTWSTDEAAVALGAEEVKAGAVEVACEELERMTEEHMVARGKYLIPALVVFLRLATTDCRKKRDRELFARKIGCKLTLQDGNVLSQLSVYADTPSCLISFLRADRP